MTVRNRLLLVTVAFFVIAFIVMSDGCSGYEGDAPNQVCVDASGAGRIVSQAAHLLFAGLAILSAALMDHEALRGRGTPGG